MSSDSSSATVGCRICLSSLRGREYAVTDNLSDKGAKCCVQCLEGWLARNNVSIIGRDVVHSFTIYGVDDAPIKTVRVGVAPLPVAPPLAVDDFMLMDSESSSADAVVMVPIPSAPEESISAESAESLSSARVSFDLYQPPPSIFGSVWNRRKYFWGGVTFGIFLVFLIAFAILYPQHLETTSYVMLGLAFGSVMVMILGCGLIECCEINSN
jgi:hypothetical protein